MSIHIVKNGKKKKLNIPATDVQILDIEDKFKHKNLEDALKEVGSGTEENMIKIEGKVNQLDKDKSNILKTMANSGYFDLARDMHGVDYKTIRDNGLYMNVTGVPTTIGGGILQVIAGKDKWGIAYRWYQIENSVVTEYTSCKDGDNFEEWKQLATINDLPNPNLLINGNFQVWQRGESFTHGNGEYTADRWCYDIEGNDNIGDNGVVKKSVNGGGISIKLMSQKRFWIGQKIELNETLRKHLSNKDLVLSFLVTSNISVNPYVEISTKTKTIKIEKYEANENTKYVSIKIKIEDIPLDEYLFVSFFRIADDNKFSCDDNKWIRFENVKLELGSVATSFVPRPYAEELALCKRYYEPFVYRYRFPNNIESLAYEFNQPFMVEKRVNPNLIFTQTTKNDNNFDFKFSNVSNKLLLNFWCGNDIMNIKSSDLVVVEGFADSEIY